MTNDKFENSKIKLRIVKSNKTQKFDVLNIFDFDNESLDDSIEFKKKLIFVIVDIVLV